MCSQTLAGIGSRIDGFRALMPNYFGGIVSNVVEMHKIATQSCFWTRSSVKKEDPKQPSGKVHIKACIIIPRTVTRIVID